MSVFCKTRIEVVFALLGLFQRGTERVDAVQKPVKWDQSEAFVPRKANFKNILHEKVPCRAMIKGNIF